MNIRMPKACISCQSFNMEGWADDSMCLYKGDYFRPTPTRTQFGTCSVHHKKCFCTEICGSYKQDDLIDVVDVTNRPAPMTPHQELLIG